jgi:hypothetical protein
MYTVFKEPDMKYCPHCNSLINDDTLVICPVCRRSTNDRSEEAPVVAQTAPLVPLRFEYKSKTELFGLPLVHIAASNSRQLTGRLTVAKGIIAIGDVAIGVLAMGGLAIGGIAFGGVGVGVLALGGMSLGLIAFGGIAVGILLALGGIALSTFAALGGLALAPYAISSLGASPELLRIIERVLPGFSQAFP